MATENEFKQPDKLLEQSLRAHYSVRFRESHGSAPAPSEVWQQVSARLAPEMVAHPWWRRWFQKPGMPRTTLFLPAPRYAPIHRLAVACSLALGILLLVSGVFYTIGVSGPHQSQHPLTGSASDAADLLLSQLLLNSKQPETRHLAQEGLFTQVNQTKGVGSSSVKIQKVYADANIIILGFTINGHISSTPIPSITLSGGQTLTPMHQIAEISDPAKPPIAVLAYFNTGSIQGNPQQLHMHISIPLAGGTEHFDLTEPFHAGKSVPINQTVTFAGRTYTFERVVITPYETRLYYIYRQGTASFNDIVMMVSISGKTYEEGTGSSASKGKEGFTDFQYDLRDHTGTWTLKTFVPSSCCQTLIGQITFLVA